MSIEGICTKSIVCTEQDTSIQEACELMRDEHVGSLVIVDSMENKRPIGIVTDRDLVMRIADHHTLLTRLGEIMSKQLITLSEDEGIEKAIQQMRYNGVRRIVVTNSDGQACGVLSADDIVRTVAQEFEDIGILFEDQPMQEGLNQFHHMA